METQFVASTSLRSDNLQSLLWKHSLKINSHNYLKSSDHIRRKTPQLRFSECILGLLQSLLPDKVRKKSSIFIPTVYLPVLRGTRPSYKTMF